MKVGSCCAALSGSAAYARHPGQQSRTAGRSGGPGGLLGTSSQGRALPSGVGSAAVQPQPVTACSCSCRPDPCHAVHCWVLVQCRCSHVTPAQQPLLRSLFWWLWCGRDTIW
jgi:hypothetical protein